MSGHPKAKLASIEVLLSTAYSPDLVTASLPAPASTPLVVHCSTTGACQNGAALFAFSTPQTLPFLALSVVLPSPLPRGIELSRTAASLAVPPSSNTDPKAAQVYATQMLQSLTPIAVSLGSSAVPTNGDLGVPLVDAQGHLMSVALSSSTPLATQAINTFLTQQIKLPAQHDNSVQQNWDAGITAFYQGASHYSEATTDFKSVLAANPQFKGAQTFLQVMASDANPTSVPQGSGGGKARRSGNTLLLVLLGIAILLVLILAVVIILGLHMRKRAQERLDGEFAEAEHIANAALEEEMRKQQRVWPQQQQAQRVVSEQTSPFYPPNLPQVAMNAKSEAVMGLSAISNASRCPNCGKPVQNSAKYCPNCRLLLSPSVSGPQVSIQQSPLPTVPMRPKEEIKLPVPTSPILPVSERLQSDKPVAPLPPAESPPVPSQQVVQNMPKETVRMNDRVGQRLGNYRLVRLLGYGAFADVYLGEHRFLKTQAAIKVLQKRLTRDALVKFLAEARTIADLIHPHIVRVLEFGVEGSEPDIEQSVSDGEAIVDGIPFLVMDYAPGGTLRKRHPKGTRLALSTLIPYVMQVAEALQYAHGKKLIHRDVKAENILVGRNGEILLSDFGIAAVAHSEGSMTTQEMAGTVPYMAPEQIRGLPRPASDQYALGVVVYEWLCGTRPFNGASIEVIMQHMTLSPPRLCEHMPSLSPKVEEVVLRALAKDPLQRFESVQTFADALKQAAE